MGENEIDQWIYTFAHGDECKTLQDITAEITQAAFNSQYQDIIPRPQEIITPLSESAFHRGYNRYVADNDQQGLEDAVQIAAEILVRRDYILQPDKKFVAYSPASANVRYREKQLLPALRDFLETTHNNDIVVVFAGMHEKDYKKFSKQRREKRISPQEILDQESKYIQERTKEILKQPSRRRTYLIDEQQHHHYEAA